MATSRIPVGQMATPIYACAFLVALLVAACSTPSVPDSTGTATLPAATTVGTVTHSSTTVPLPAQNECAGELRFLAVVNYPDGARVTTGETIQKQWRIRNESDCAVGAGYVWRFTEGLPDAQHDFGHPVLPMPGDVPPHGDYDLTVNLVMPDQPGEYEGRWQLVRADGTVLDEYIRLRVAVSTPGNPLSR